MSEQAMVRKDGSPIMRGRVSPVLRTALTLIVHEGLSITDAAQRVGLKRESLSKALKKPHVRAEWDAVKRAWSESATAKAWLTVAKLAETASSEDVRLKAAKVFLEAAGEIGAEASGRASAPPASMVQIIVQPRSDGDQSMPYRLPGVIERPSQQVIDVDPSNYREVGRGEKGDQ